MASRRGTIGFALITLLTAWLAAAATPAVEPDGRPEAERDQTEPPPADHRVLDLDAETARLRDRLDAMVEPRPLTRNPFEFARAARAEAGAPAPAAAIDASALPATPVLPPAPPVVTLLGIAEQATDGTLQRTAILSYEGELWLVGEGAPVGARYRVARIGAEDVDLVEVAGSAPDAVDGRTLWVGFE